MAIANLTIDVTGMPDVIWAVRRELAKLLREEAEAEISNTVAAKLREIADRFEAGQ